MTMEAGTRKLRFNHSHWRFGFEAAPTPSVGSLSKLSRWEDENQGSSGAATPARARGCMSRGLRFFRSVGASPASKLTACSASAARVPEDTQCSTHEGDTMRAPEARARVREELRVGKWWWSAVDTDAATPPSSPATLPDDVGCGGREALHNQSTQPRDLLGDLVGSPGPIKEFAVDKYHTLAEGSELDDRMVFDGRGKRRRHAASAGTAGYRLC